MKYLFYLKILQLTFPRRSFRRWRITILFELRSPVGCVHRKKNSSFYVSFYGSSSDRGNNGVEGPSVEDRGIGRVRFRWGGGRHGWGTSGAHTYKKKWTEIIWGKTVNNSLESVERSFLTTNLLPLPVSICYIYIVNNNKNNR